MNLRHALGILIVCLILQYSYGGLCVDAILLNDSNSITVAENTTKFTNIKNNNNSSIKNNTTSIYEYYPLNCPKWDDYKNQYTSPITNFWEYWDVLKEYVNNYVAIDDYNVQISKSNYQNNTGYFSGNPISGDTDYRYMPTSKLNEAYSAAALAKSRIALPNTLSTSLEATYTIAAVILGALSGIVGIITTIVGIVTASSAGATSPVLVVCIVFTGMVVATTIAIGICTGVIVKSSSGINVEYGIIENRMAIMNAELTYRSTMPTYNNTTIIPTEATLINKTKNKNSTNNETINNETIKNNTSSNKSMIEFTEDNVIKNKIQENNVSDINCTENKTVKNSGNILGINDVPPSTKTIAAEPCSNGTGTYMDTIYDVDISGFPQKPTKPNPKWYEFWLWIDYGFKYMEWCGDVLGWGFNHLDSLNKFTGICKHIVADSKNLPG